MSEGDRQVHDAVGLAMHMSAMEALLAGNENEKSITASLAENTATLLEPEGVLRMRAEEYVKRLYSQRSKLLHGASVEGEAQSRQQAQMLVSASLRAVVERRTFRERFGDQQEAPAELFDALRWALRTNTRVDGVTDSPIRQLWGTA